MASFHFYPPVTVQSAPIVGAATEAKQDAQIAILNTLGTQTTLAALLTELQLKADLSETQPVSAASLPLPAGASTEVTLAALLTELQLKADLTETQPVSATSLPLPTGAATDANQALVIAELEKITDEIVTGDGLKVVIDNPQDISPAPQAGGFTRVDPAVTTINDAGYAEIIASTAVAYKGFKLFQQGGNNIIFATGAASAEADQYLIFPGDTNEVLLDIPAGTRISLRSLAGTVNATQIVFNWLV
jgi:hypothetical protein